jgi:hypothetical protein
MIMIMNDYIAQHSTCSGDGAGTEVTLPLIGHERMSLSLSPESERICAVPVLC